MVAALPILKSGSCWRVGNGESIKVYVDKWILNCPANRVLYQGQDVEREMMVSELIDADLHGWRRDVIIEKFCREEVDAICRISLSRRYIADSVFEVFIVQAWLLWNQRNVVAHGGQLRDPKLLNQRAVEYLDEYRKVQDQITLPNTATQSRQS
ncbi:hypothetical protein SO802_012464 [Lithocarpus litseifolius]|uniref:Uncharacterized protein n=1 Tax=Lithocarpus litseifolius TaxID=425828 RepID=A0AAW2D5C0_9ROSI